MGTFRGYQGYQGVPGVPQGVPGDMQNCNVNILLLFLFCGTETGDVYYWAEASDETTWDRPTRPPAQKR